MELYQEMLGSLLAQGKISLVTSDSGEAIERLLESECYRTLNKIKTILADNSLNDAECFGKIEEIVMTFESIGSHCGERHDFG